VVLLTHSVAFDSADPLTSLRELQEAPGIFALYADLAAEPYLGKTPNLRRRLMRFLRQGSGGNPDANAAPASKRLQLAHMVRHIEYTVTGSEFESLLCLYDASLKAFGDRGRRRLRLHPPAFLRMSVENAYPRVYPTTKITKSAATALFGPFPSRAAAERYSEAMLDLFLLRRCTDDLNPDPAFPGCPYSEMKMCLAPCFKGCTDERYEQEADAVYDFLATRGAGLLQKLEAERNGASELLEFEHAASLHQRIQKVEAAGQLASEAVHPLSQLSGILVQPAAEPESVALFRLHMGALNGPVLFSTIGMRLANERSGSTSLFAHPVAVEPVPLEAEPAPTGRKQPMKDVLEQRVEDVLAQLEKSAPKSVPTQVITDHLALFTRWFYRPAVKRVGEVLFAGSDGEVAHKPLLRSISRAAARAASEDPQQMDKPPIAWHA
jgi:excinuclease ABC subunit C